MQLVYIVLRNLFQVDGVKIFIVMKILTSVAVHCIIVALIYSLCEDLLYVFWLLDLLILLLYFYVMNL